MIQPDIRNYHDTRRSHFISPIYDRLQFLGHSPLEIHKQENLYKKDQLYTLEIPLPGFSKDEFIITIVDNILTIRAESQIEERRSSQFLLREFKTDKIERRYVLGNAIGHEQVTAKYEDGVLSISFKDVPREQESDHKIVEIS